jgi:hypothetical protein
VFSTVGYGDGEIDTGWTYADGSAKTPIKQFCYYTRRNPDGSSYKVDIAVNREPNAAARGLVSDFDGAVNRCVWWKPGA